MLEGAALAIHEVRPALLTAPSHRLANELLRFWHFLRHAYGSDLDERRVGELVTLVAAERASLEADLDALEGFLASMADQLDG